MRPEHRLNMRLVFASLHDELTVNGVLKIDEFCEKLATFVDFVEGIYQDNLSATELFKFKLELGRYLGGKIFMTEPDSMPSKEIFDRRIFYKRHGDDYFMILVKWSFAYRSEMEICYG